VLPAVVAAPEVVAEDLATAAVAAVPVVVVEASVTVAVAVALEEAVVVVRNDGQTDAREQKLIVTPGVGKPMGRGGPRGGARGGRGGGAGQRGGAKVIVEPHRHPGVFVVRGGKEDGIATRNITPGESVYGEKRVSVDEVQTNEDGSQTTTKVEYRTWNPFRSKLCAAIAGGADDIYMKPGSRVLYLGGASGTSVSHVADLVGPTGFVYAVEFSSRSGRDLVSMASKRTNVVPIVEDARQPARYRMVVPMVDVIFADVAQPDQARIVAMNANWFLKAGGGVLISIKANCIDSTAPAAEVFAAEVQKMRADGIKPKFQLTLEPFERDHCLVAGIFNRTQKSA